MITYKIRSRDLIDLVNDVKNRRLIMSPYFQRNLVWRVLHKVDFIKTILLGYPIPQIFIAKGSIDLESMQSISCLVDGQQRMNSIMEYIKDAFAVDGLTYSQLPVGDKETFLKYQVPILDLDISNEDPKIIEIFTRLNRTFYSLSTIERISTVFASSEFMLAAKALIKPVVAESEDMEEDLPLQQDPNIPSSSIKWAENVKIKYFNRLILESGIFTNYELSRQVHLMFTLNTMATFLGGHFNRNENAMNLLEDLASDFPDRDKVVNALDKAASKYLKLKLKKNSYWLNKANAFTLLTCFAENVETLNDIDEKLLREKLGIFENNLPEEYRLAAKEAVNNKRERMKRREFINGLIVNLQN